MKKKFCITIFLFLVSMSLTTSCGRVVDQLKDFFSPQDASNRKEVVEYARENFPQEGLLYIKSDGYVYLKVDDRYINTLFPMLGLAKKGFRKPPFFRTPDSPGAHITVFYANEHVFPDEIGEIFHFKLKNIEMVHSRNATYAVLQIESPELEKLRKKYGLKVKYHGHQFHISLAKKKHRRF